MMVLADEIDRLANKEPFTPADQKLFDRAQKSFDARNSELEGLERDAKLKEAQRLMQDPANIERGDGFDAPQVTFRGDPYTAPDTATQSTPDHELRSAALTGIERWNAEDSLKESASKLVEQTDDPRGIGEHVLRTSNPAYLSAFRKFMKDPEGYRDLFTNEERAAWAGVRQWSQRAALDISGAVLPSPLDPAIVLSNAGTLDPMRSVARVDQTVANSKRYITSAGVSASFDGELVEVSDDTPSLVEPTITCQKAQAFVQASVEAAMDQPDISEEVARMFGDARARLEGANFIAGVAGSNQPIGIETALDGGASEVAPATAEVFAAADVYGLIEALPPRYRANARWMAELSTLNQIDQFETGNGAKLFPEVGASDPVILRRGVAENSNVDAFSDVNVAATADNFILYVGDWSNYVILDRVGMSIELIPHLLNTANNLPDGRRGWYSFWRVGADSINDDGFRVLNLATTA